MNISADNDSQAAGNSRKLALLDPRNWSIKWKVRLNFLLRAVVATSLMVLMVNLLQRRTTVRETYEQLGLLSDTKARFIEDYFGHLDQMLINYASERQTLDAFNQLTGSFLNIETDNFYTSSVTDLAKVNTLVEGFYETEVIPAFDAEANHKINLASLLPEDNKQRILQFLYLAANPKPLNAKGTLNQAEDGSAYSYMHGMYHPAILKFSREAEISDILFVDYQSGYVTYSVKKNLDFATSLFTGPYRNSGLGMAFKSAIALDEQDMVAYTDASNYLPSFYQSCIFLSVPVFSGTQKLGAIVFAISSAGLDNLLTYGKEGVNSGTLKSLLLGNDLLYRNNDPEFLADPEKYLRKLKRNAALGETATKVDKYNGTAMVQGVDPLVFTEAKKGKEGQARYITETGDKAFCTYRPLKVDNLNWILVTQMSQSDAMAQVNRFSVALIIIALCIALLLYYIAGVTSEYINNRLQRIRDLVVSLANGDKVGDVKSDSADEIGQIFSAIGKLSHRINSSSEFVTDLGKGAINVDFTMYGENDYFGRSMNSLKSSLALRREEEEQRKKEDAIRNWTTQGIALFNDILRMDNNNLEKLSLNIIRNIIQYLSANQGGLFLIEQEDNGDYLNLVASYAYDRHKYHNKRIASGEGMAGVCVLEKKTILTNKIPSDYMHITSGLGGANPQCLMIVPLKKDEDVLGVLEIASFADFKPHEVEFVEKVAESIASALITVKLHLQTSLYLERFQQQAEEMKAQDEELRQSIEELQATHEQMERLKLEENERNQKLIKEIDDYRKLLINVLNEVPEKIFLKDDQGRFVIANKQVAENYNRTVDELLGKSDFDFYSREEAAEYFRREQEIMHGGKTESYEEGDASRYDGLIVRTIKKPFYIEHLGVTGLFGVQLDISDIKRKEYEALKMADEIKEKQHAIEVASVELTKEKALMDALMNNVPELIYFKDKQSKFIRFSKSMLNLFGLQKPEELIGKSDFDFFAEEHSRPAYEDEQRIIASGKAIIDFEEKEVMEDGRVRYVNTTKMPLLDGNGEIIGTFGITKDISHMKKMQQDAIEANEELITQEEELRQNLEEMMATQDDMKRQLEENERIKVALGKEKALMEALMNNVPELIYFKDKESRFIRISKSMLKLFGLQNPEELIGKSDFDFFADEHARPAYEDEQRIIKTRKAIYDLEEKEVMEDGRVRWVNTTKIPLLDSNGEVLGTFGITKDISHIKVMQQEANEANEELKSQEEELRQNLEEMRTTQEDLLRQIEENRKIQDDLGKEKALMDALMDNIPESIYFKDRKSRFIRFSKSLMKLFGLTKQEDLLGKTDFDFFSEEHARPAYEHEQKIIKTGKAIIDLEEKEVLDDGRVNWVNTTKMPIRNASGEILGTFGISKNITRIKKLELEVSEEAKLLKEKEEKLAALEKELDAIKKRKQ